MYVCVHRPVLIFATFHYFELQFTLKTKVQCELWVNCIEYAQWGNYLTCHFSGFNEHIIMNTLVTYTTAKKKRPNQLGYLVGIWL